MDKAKPRPWGLFENKLTLNNMASTRDNQKFTESLFIGTSLLEDALEWIRDNMKPNQVFGDNELGEWAEANGFVKEAP